MKKLKTILMALIVIMTVSCGGSNGGSYESVVKNFVDTASSFNADYTASLQKAMKNDNLDQEAWVAEATKKAEKNMSTLMSMTCYNGELLSDDNKSAMEKKVGNKMIKLVMESYSINRAAELRDGTVAYVEVEMIKNEAGIKSTEVFLLKKVDGSWKIELNAWGKEFSELKDEFEAKMAE